MSKIIIHNKSSINDEHAVRLVANVMAYGRISDDGKNYCRISVYQTGDTRTQVYARRNTTSDLFWLTDVIDEAD